MPVRMNSEERKDLEKIVHWARFENSLLNRIYAKIIFHVGEDRAGRICGNLSQYHSDMHHAIEKNCDLFIENSVFLERMDHYVCDGIVSLANKYYEYIICNMSEIQGCMNESFWDGAKAIEEFRNRLKMFCDTAKEFKNDIVNPIRDRINQEQKKLEELYDELQNSLV